MAPAGVYPRAIWRPVPRALLAPRITPTAMVLHSNAGSGGDLYGWWINPAAGGLYSHFQVGLDGTVWQYCSIFRRAPANVAANPFAVSFETANTRGHGRLPEFDRDVWPEPMRASIIDSMDWVAAQTGIPRAPCVDGRRGIGGHDWYDAWRTRGHVCPGTARNAQIRTDIIPTVARHAPEVPDVTLTKEQAKQLSTAARMATIAAEQAPQAALHAAGAHRLSSVAMSWLAHGGVPAGITEIYRKRLGRDPDPAGMASWTRAATHLTYDEIDRRIADSKEAKARA